MIQDIHYLTLGEFFSGPGCLALGAIMAESNNNGNILGIKHAWTNDHDNDTCRKYLKNICKNEIKSY